MPRPQQTMLGESRDTASPKQPLTVVEEAYLQVNNGFVDQTQFDALVFLRNNAISLCMCKRLNL